MFPDKQWEDWKSKWFPVTKNENAGSMVGEEQAKKEIMTGDRKSRAYLWGGGKGTFKSFPLEGFGEWIVDFKRRTLFPYPFLFPINQTETEKSISSFFSSTSFRFLCPDALYIHSRHLQNPGVLIKRYEGIIFWNVPEIKIKIALIIYFSQ